MKIKLTKRMQQIASLVSNCNTVCDVGCDHGKILAYLLTENKCEFGYATDISAPSLAKCEKLLTSLNVENFKCVHCNGLEGLNNQIKTLNSVIIAGMGGYEIIQIISNAKMQINELVLSPQKDEIEVRKFLNSIGFKIVTDLVLYDKNKPYMVMKAVRGKQKHKKHELYYGKTQIKNLNEDFVRLLNNDLIKLENLSEKYKLSKENKKQLKFIKKLLKK